MAYCDKLKSKNADLVRLKNLLSLLLPFLPPWPVRLLVMKIYDWPKLIILRVLICLKSQNMNTSKCSLEEGTILVSWVVVELLKITDSVWPEKESKTDYQEVSVNDILIYLGFSEVFEGQLFRSKHKKWITSGCNSEGVHQTEIKVNALVPFHISGMNNMKSIGTSCCLLCLWNQTLFVLLAIYWLSSQF